MPTGFDNSDEYWFVFVQTEVNQIKNRKHEISLTVYLALSDLENVQRFDVLKHSYLVDWNSFWLDQNNFWTVTEAHHCWTNIFVE